MPHSFGNTGTDDGVRGSSTTGRRVVGESVGQAGIIGSSTNFVGVWGENHSPATAGHPGVFGSGANWEGVHGETNSTVAAGIQLNPNGTGAGVYGESHGKGHAGFLKVIVTLQVRIQSIATLFFQTKTARRILTSDSTNVEPGTVMALDERGLLQESRQDYDKKVAGVISGAGKFKHGLILGRDKGQSDSHRATVARALQRMSAGQKGLIPLLVALQ